MNDFITDEARLALILKDEMNKLDQHQFKPSDPGSLDFKPRMTKKEVHMKERDNLNREKYLAESTIWMIHSESQAKSKLKEIKEENEEEE